MKRSNWVRLIAVILVISMMIAPVTAVPNRGNGASTNSLTGFIAGFLKDIVKDIFEDQIGNPGEEEPAPTDPIETTAPTEPGEPAPSVPGETTEPGEPEPTTPGETKPAESPETELNLIEGHSNVENGHLLRGVTYSLSQVVTEKNAPLMASNSSKDKGSSLKTLSQKIGGVQTTAETQAEEAVVYQASTTAATDLGLTNVDDSAKFVIVSAVTSTREMVANAKTMNNGYMGLELATRSGVNDVAANAVWTITKVENGYTVSNGDQNVAIKGNHQATLEADAVVQIKKGNNGTDDWVIYANVKGTDYCLNDHDSFGEVFSHGCAMATFTNLQGSRSMLKLYKVTEVVTEPKPETPVVNPADSSRDIPVDVLTATAGNAETERGNDGPEKTLDGNSDTMWHTAWAGSDRSTHWIQFQLSEEYEVDGLRYQPRQSSDSVNGIVTEYEIQVSYDGQNFTPVTTGTWTYDGRPWQIATFNAVNAKYVRLVVKNAMSDNNTLFASAAEIRLTGVKVTGEPDQPAITDGKLIRFPVTMFNYDQDTINSWTDSLDDDLTVREGLYFSAGGGNGELPAVTQSTYDLSAYVDGQYMIQNYKAKDYQQTNSWLGFNANADTMKLNSFDQENGAVWTLDNLDNGKITLSTMVDGKTYYLDLGDDTSSMSETPVELALEYYSGTTSGIQIKKDSYYLSYYDGTNYCGSLNNRDSQWNGVGFFPVAEDGTVSTTALTVTVTNTVTSGYERWNFWCYLSPNGNDAQNKFYTGLVEDELDENNELVFKVKAPGIFTIPSDPTVTDDGVKEIYQNVGLPFVKSSDGYYTFDSDAHGTYFADTNGDGESDPWYGAEDNYFNMYFDYQKTQGWEGMNYGDGSSKLWAPYNTNANDTSGDDIDYHFGMRADIPFSMTANGCIKSNDDTSEHITFSFAGDDDVWIFIDGHLVIDLGGIHNRIGATIDFHENTITYERPATNTNTLPIGSFNDPENYPLNEDGTITVKLYNDADGEGALGQTRTDFSADEEHVMTIFYLERGKGTSNCKIRFNLPMRDTLLVTKDATQSWSEEQDKADGDEGDGTVNLTTKEQAAVDNMLFGFTLYKKNHDETGFSPVTNTNFYVQNQNGEILDIQSTDSNGKFYLKNGQTAKFMTDFPEEGVTYYVVEDKVPEGFLTPDYNYAGVSTDGFDYSGVTLDENGQRYEITDPIHVSNASLIPEQELPIDETLNKSYVVTAYGSIEAIDSLEFICTNYLDADLPNPSAFANEDMIVLDYGLPVQIDPLANDLVRSDAVEIVAWGDESLKLNEVLDGYENAIVDQTTWSGTQNFEFGTVEFDEGSDTFTYTLTEQLTHVEEIYYIIKATSTIKVVIDGKDTGETKSASRYSLGRIYIAPATIMYYEENFSDMVTFTDNTKTGNKWGDTIITDGKSEYQEPGVVGDIEDSTYGSDVAYLNDSFDSNGTSRKADTTNGALQFSYTFTGTGTSIFARTSDKTGYIQVKLYKGETATGDYIDIDYRDTYWKDANDNELDDSGTLYNIPVYTNDGLDYGTYTVVCTIAKAGTHTAGNDKGSGAEFYLDGIRVMQPLNEDSEDDLTKKALTAYATDGESNLEVVTLRQKLITDYDSLVPEEGSDTDEEAWPFAVLTDIDGEIVLASDYISIGPKEEVYLSSEVDESNAQTVSFSLKYWETEGLKLYMGMKAPFGNAKVAVGHKVYELKNATDCYYDVTANYTEMLTDTEQLKTDEGMYVYTDANGNTVYEKVDPQTDDSTFYNEDGNEIEVNYEELTEVMREFNIVTYTFTATDSIVSLTNIKVVGNYEFTIVENTNTDVEVPGTTNDAESGEEVTE